MSDRTQRQDAWRDFTGGSWQQRVNVADFIHRNYDQDGAGCWFFQNGPQRVYVELELAPLVLRIGPAGSLAAHTGRAARFKACFVDEHGRLYVDTDLGLGLVHTLDMHAAADLVESRSWTPEQVDSSQVPNQFGFVRSPQARQVVANGS